eukprot:TRINITY_DN1983_c2_g1_i2.p1 TRINITY_DN1983_c2_g1~~TRINITY_DN1983_c2_g1_i2.p1  ORF type:complete len:284 (-),score=36.40 TRINITY_DN1983_c2_g1_i2:391-1131(-)
MNSSESQASLDLEREVAQKFAALQTLSSMERFKKISGVIGDKYEVYISDKINVDDYTEDQVLQLLNKGFEKFYGYVKGGSWHNALVDYKNNCQSLAVPDPETQLEYEQKGYKLQKELYRSFRKNIHEFEWIQDPIEINFKKVYGLKIYFQWDRYSELSYSGKTLEQDQFVTYKNVLDFVDEFYEGFLSVEELAKVKDTDDGWGYAEKAGEALERNQQIQRLEVMGDCQFFEGFRNYEDGWILNLGS